MADSGSNGPKRRFPERTGQWLWDIPELRMIFGSLKRKEQEQQVQKQALKRGKRPQPVAQVAQQAHSR